MGYFIEADVQCPEKLEKIKNFQQTCMMKKNMLCAQEI